MSQDELVRRAQGGDRDAFGQLAVAQVDRMHATAFLVLRSPDAARDATQEALLDAWRGLPGLRDPARFGPWLNRLLLRRCSRHRGKAGRPSDWDRAIDLTATYAPSIPDGTDVIGDRDELERGFAQLMIDQRMILVMRFYLDMSIEDVATALEVPVGTVKSRTTRALDAMRAALASNARHMTITMQGATDDRR